MNKTGANGSSAERALLSHLRLVSAGQIQEWVDLFAADGILEFPYAPAGVPERLQGQKALLDYMIHFPETFDVKFVDVVFHEMVDPNLAIAEFRSTGRALPTGKTYEQTCISVVRTNEDGKIIRYVDYWNPLIAVEALTPSAS